MKKIISMLMVMIMSLNICIMANASEETDPNDGISLYYLYTVGVNANLSISSKTATCTGRIEGTPGKATKITITVYLEKKNGTSWTEVTHQSKTVSSSGASIAFTKASLSSGSYRVRTTGKVYSGTKYESVKDISDTRSC